MTLEEVINVDTEAEQVDEDMIYAAIVDDLSFEAGSTGYCGISFDFCSK